MVEIYKSVVEDSIIAEKKAQSDAKPMGGKKEVKKIHSATIYGGVRVIIIY